MILTDARGREIDPDDWVVWFHQDRPCFARVQQVIPNEGVIMAGHMEVDPSTVFVTDNRAHIMMHLQEYDQ